MTGFLKKVSLMVVLILAATFSAGAFFLYPPEPRAIAFPDGKRFAFSIVDDTDLTSLERVKPLYELLHRYGFRTTKTVWVMESNEVTHRPNQGATLHQ